MSDTAPQPGKPKLRLVKAESPAERIERIARHLRELDQAAAIAELGARDVERALKTTVSLCPECLAHVPAIVFERAGRVILSRRCEAHGPSEALIESDARFYALSNKDRHGRRFADAKVFRIPELPGACCGPGESCAPSPGAGTDQMANRTCTVLVEITDACNMNCRVCYSESAGERYLPLHLFQEHVGELIAKKGRLDSVQITGGEASLHPRYWHMIEWLYQQEGVGKIYLPTNGLKLRDAAVRERLAPYADKVMVLLQFDSIAGEPTRALRRADPLALRRRVIEGLDALGVPMQLTMTLAMDVNDAEVGQVIDLALAHESVKLVAMQPVTTSGRFELPIDPMRRATLSDVAHAVVRQSKLRMSEESFIPIPCSHPNCGWISVFLRRFGMVHDVVRYIDLDEAMDDVAYKTLLSTDELRNVVGTSDRSVLHRVAGWLGRRLVRSTDMFSIAIKPFMDRYTYDQDRIANCCHHITDTRGNLLSFCEHNAIGRRHDDWSRLPTRDGV
ncbi:MAG: radical SAM protein [Sandaracinaceae bacterium]|nr:radical SAM protein [Sandaracinaceae bacterium]